MARWSRSSVGMDARRTRRVMGAGGDRRRGWTFDVCLTASDVLIKPFSSVFLAEKMGRFYGQQEL